MGVSSLGAYAAVWSRLLTQFRDSTPCSSWEDLSLELNPVKGIFKRFPVFPQPVTLWYSMSNPVPMGYSSDQ